MSFLRGLRLSPEVTLILGRGVGCAATFLIPVALARAFDPADFGTYKQLFLIFATLYYIAQIGMAESLFYFVPRDRDGGARHAVNSVLALAGMGVVTLLGLWAFAPRVATLMANPALQDGIPWIGLFLFLMLISSGWEILLMARGRYRPAAFAYAGSDVLRALALTLPGVLLGSVRAVLYGAVAFALVRVAATVFTLRREFPRGLAPDAAVFRRQLAYTLPFGAAVMVEILQTNLHQYVVSAKVTPAIFAVYAVGCLQIPVIDLISGPSGNVMMVRMAAPGTTPAAGLALFHGTIRKLALVFFPMAAFLMVSARDIIEALFTSRYAASAPIFVAWSATVVLAAIPTDCVLRVHGRTRDLFLINIVRLCVVIGSISLLMRVFGLVGAALATFLGVAVAKGAMLLRIGRLLEAGPVRLLPWGALASAGAIAAGAALPVIAAGPFLGGSPFLRLAADGLLFGAAGLLLFLLLGRRPAAAPPLPVGSSESCAVSQAS
ncbi:MAG TPA: oligosaccharide flippase family protein [Candidatus Polarisedimenticolia bacterium]|nr:oligosaccharide flippase family protein [Candidatus Polarisedimenticolia bacterium]